MRELHSRFIRFTHDLSTSDLRTSEHHHRQPTPARPHPRRAGAMGCGSSSAQDCRHNIVMALSGRPIHSATPGSDVMTASTSSADLHAPVSGVSTDTLAEIEQRVLWLSTSIIHHANRIRPNPTGLKVGGHQASCASMVSIMTSLWFEQLRPGDRVSVKPHASRCCTASTTSWGSWTRST